MSTLTLPNPTFTPNTTADATQVTANNTAITTWANGNIDNSNLSASAGITLSKLSLTGVAFNKGTTATQTWASGLSTDTNPQVALMTDAGIQFGPGGSGALDVQLKRSAANTLQLAKAGGGSGATLDMNSGSITNFTLGTAIGVSGGGTGLTTLTSGSFLTGNGTSPVTLVASPLPVANGGTGTVLFTSGTATFTGSGTVDVTDATVTANTIVIVTCKNSSALSEEFSYSLTVGTKFSLHSSNASSTATLGFIRIG